MSLTPSTNELVILGAPVALRDGSHVRVRQAHRSDKDLLLRGFERLSPESRYRRFLAPMPQLTEAMVRYLTEVDHHDHEERSSRWRRRPAKGSGWSATSAAQSAATRRSSP